MYSLNSFVDTIDFFPDPVVIIDREHRVVAWNKSMVFLTGVSVEQAKDFDISNRHHLWLADLIVNPALKRQYSYNVYEQDRQLYVTDYVFTYDGENQQLFNLQATPITDENGNILGAIEIIRDSSFFISTNLEIKEAQYELEMAYQQITAVEEELRQQFDELQHTTAIQKESERRFRTLLEEIQFVAVILDLDLTIKFINDYTLELSGWQRDDVVGKPYEDIFFPPQYQEIVKSWIKDAIKNPVPVGYGHIPIQTRSGDYRYIDWNSVKLFNGNGQLEGLAFIGNNVTERVLAERELRKQLDYTNTMIDNLNEIFYTFDMDMRLTFINKKSEEVLGYPPDQLIGTTFNKSHVAPEDWDWIRAETQRRLLTGKPASYVLPWLHRDGHKIYLKINSTALREGEKIIGGMVLADDITEDIKSSEALRASEQNLRRITNNMLDLIAEIDMEGHLIYCSPSHFKLLGYSEDEMRSIKFRELVHPQDLDGVLEANLRFMSNGQPFVNEQRCRRADGSYVWTETLGNPVIIDGKLSGVILCTRDITARKKLEQELRYINIHDLLTSLYNRTFFEEQIAQLESGRNKSVGIMICDLDGLKLVNDTLGHTAGDLLLKKTGEILRSCFLIDDIIARVGGDEFAVLLPQANPEILEQRAQEIQKLINQYNEENLHLPLSISIGTAVYKNAEMSLRDVYKEADNNMYRFKLNNSKSARNAVVQTLMKALEARDFITEGHGERMQQLVTGLGIALDLPANMINTLSLLAQFHDIGKVGIPDRILFKPSPLNDAEYLEMKRHCEIGHRIALASQELASLADLILKHHEWWDGGGYPLGLAGEQIPIECRILALADAYDAMTSDRPYRQAISSSEALKQICLNAGTQFDPFLTQQFASVIENLSYK
ncbi:MAG: PAS domain S-box protein [Methylocystaceae bacterium]